jgi:hypothetical protein
MLLWPSTSQLHSNNDKLQKLRSSTATLSAVIGCTNVSLRICVTSCALLIRQTLLVQIFAPLARLLGLYSIKEELEELSFKFSNPEAHGQMVKRIRVLSETQHDVVQAVSHSYQSCFVIALSLHSLTHLLTHSFCCAF